MRLNAFITTLNKTHPDTPIRFHCPICTRKVPEYSEPYVNSVGVGDFYAYRDYYDNLSIEPSMTPTCVREVSEKARDALGSYFPGYKGGLYKMTLDTPLWCSYYGTGSNLYIDWIEIVKGKAVIYTREQLIDYGNGDTEIEGVLEKMGFRSNHIQYSLDGGETWKNAEFDTQYDHFDNYKDCAYFTESAMHLRHWSAEQFCEFALKIDPHSHVVVKPVV